jgi:hypothetical protein
MMLLAPAPRPTADERARSLPSRAAAGRAGINHLPTSPPPDANATVRGLVAGGWVWDDPAWSMNTATHQLGLSDQRISFDLALNTLPTGYPAIRLGLFEQEPTDPDFYRMLKGHSREAAIDVVLSARGYCELSTRGLRNVLTVRPPMPVDGQGTMHVDLWWYHAWWEFDLDGVPMAFGPSLDPPKGPLQMFFVTYSGSGKVSGFQRLDLGGERREAEEKQPPRASDF